MPPMAMIWAGSGVEQWLVVVGADLGDGGELRLGCVDAEDVAGAGAGVVRVAHAESATKGGLGIDRVSEAHARAEVGEVRIDQGLAVGSAVGDRSDAVAGDGSGGGGENGLRDWIEVRDAVVEVGVGRAVLPAQAEVERQIRKGLPVVLRVEVVDVLREVGDVVVGERVGVGGAEEEVGPVGVADGGSTGVRVAAAVGEGAVERVVVVDGHPDVLVLVAELHGVVALHPGEVDLWVDEGRILPLGVGALATEAGEAGDADGRQAAGDDGVAGGQAGDVVEVGVADGEVELAGLGAVETEAGIEDLVGTEEVGVAEGDLLVEDADVAVGLAVEGDRNAGVVDAVLLAVADAQERGVGGIDLPVEAKVALVGVIGEGNLDGVVVGGETVVDRPETGRPEICLK